MRPPHVDGPRAECPGCVHQDALTEKLVAAARAQLASTDPTDGHLSADALARLVLEYLGIDP